jgi:hypothetical protein
MLAEERHAGGLSKPVSENRLRGLYRPYCFLYFFLTSSRPSGRSFKHFSALVRLFLDMVISSAFAFELFFGSETISIKQFTYLLPIWGNGSARLIHLISQETKQTN